MLPRLPCPGGKALPKWLHELISRQLNGLVCRQLLRLGTKDLHHLHRYNPRRLWRERGREGGREGEIEREREGGERDLAMKIK